MTLQEKVHLINHEVEHKIMVEGPERSLLLGPGFGLELSVLCD